MVYNNKQAMRQRYEAVWFALGLTDRQKFCVREYFWNNKTLEKIAHQLGLTRSVVHAHLRLAEKKLIRAEREGNKNDR